MRTGVIKTRSGTAYKSTKDYVKVFKTFWHWYEKIMLLEKIINTSLIILYKENEDSLVYTPFYNSASGGSVYNSSINPSFLLLIIKNPPTRISSDPIS